MFEYPPGKQVSEYLNVDYYYLAPGIDCTLDFLTWQNNLTAAAVCCWRQHVLRCLEHPSALMSDILRFLSCDIALIISLSQVPAYGKSVITRLTDIQRNVCWEQSSTSLTLSWGGMWLKIWLCLFFTTRPHLWRISATYPPSRGGRGCSRGSTNSAKSSRKRWIRGRTSPTIPCATQIITFYYLLKIKVCSESFSAMFFSHPVRK